MVEAAAHFIAGALGAFARIATGTTQQPLTLRTGVECMVAGFGSWLIPPIARVAPTVLSAFGLPAPLLDRWDQLGLPGQMAVLFGLSYIGGHVYRALEHRRELRRNGGNGDH